MSPDKRKQVERKDKTMNRATDGELPAELPAELKAFEARLAALTPRPDRLDREALLFEAGRASAEVGSRHRWAWPSAFGAMATVAAVLLAVVLLQPDPQPVVEYVYVERPAEPEPIPAEEVPQVPESPVLPQMPAKVPAERSESLMATAVREWLGVGSLESSPRQRQLEALLAQGPDAIRLPSDSPKNDRDAGHATDPQPYWRLRDTLLEGAISDRPSATPAVKSPLKHGVSS